MPTFIATITFTPQGMANIHETTVRAAALKAAARKVGVKVRDIFWTLGPFDGLLVFESPDEETATALMLQLGAHGNVHTQTARAFTAAEMEKIVQAKSR